jgi:hypothetical protein
LQKILSLFKNNSTSDQVHAELTSKTVRHSFAELAPSAALLLLASRADCVRAKQYGIESLLPRSLQSGSVTIRSAAGVVRK